MDTTTTDADLVARAASGGEYAFRELYQRHVRPVYWIAHGLLKNAADAEDIAQETFVVAWKKLPGFVLEGDSLLPWLATICRYQASNRLRSRRREEAHRSGEADEMTPSTINVEDQVISRDYAETILKELAALTELDREIFRLCATEGYAYAAAAEELKVTSGTVRNRLSRIRTRLRTAVSESEIS